MQFEAASTFTTIIIKLITCLLAYLITYLHTYLQIFPVFNTDEILKRQHIVVSVNLSV